MSTIKVVDLQRALIARGFSLPRFGADGRGGPETFKALNDFKVSIGQKPDGRLDVATLTALGLAPWRPTLFQSLAIGLVEAAIRRTSMFEFLDGKKTYLTLVIAAITIVANHFWGPLPGIGLDPDQWLVQLGALLPAAGIRAAIPDKKKVENGGTK